VVIRFMAPGWKMRKGRHGPRRDRDGRDHRRLT
jgi:hypothetical protein